MTNNPYHLNWIPEIASRQGNVYKAIADAISDDIKSGKLQPGMRLPPRRLLAYTLGLNLGTVHKAYKVAAERGLILGEVGRGSFIKGTLSAGISWPNENPYERAIDFCDNFPCPIRKTKLFQKQMLALGNNQNLGNLLQYQQNSALPMHKNAAFLWLRRFGVEAKPEHVVISNGALHAGFISLLTLCRAGDTVLTEEFTSQAIKGAANRLKLRLKGVKMDGDGILPEHLEELLHEGKVSAAYFVPTLHNPTATLLPLQRRMDVARLLTKYGVPLIEDDIFAPLLDSPPPSISSFMPELGFYIAGLSKAMAPALRLAFMKVPERYYQEVMDNLRVTTWFASPLLMEVASELITCGGADRLIEDQKSEIQKRQMLARQTLRGFGGTGHSQALHLWLKLPRPWRSDSFRNSLSEKEVIVLASDTFAVEKNQATHAVRVCLGTPPLRPHVAEGLQIIRNMLVS